MASQATKMFAVFALLALFARAATAIIVRPPYFSPTMATGAMDPCMQYCMVAFTLPTTMMKMLQQQFGMQTMMPSTMMTLPQCNCAAIWQMMTQQQQYMKMAMQFPFTSRVMAPSPFFQQPFVGDASFQQPFLGCGF
jgi:hypothetical protein